MVEIAEYSVEFARNTDDGAKSLLDRYGVALESELVLAKSDHRSESKLRIWYTLSVGQWSRISMDGKTTHTCYMSER